MKINQFLRFEKLRDGGSLIVSFQSDDSCKYWVMFPIANDSLEKTIFGEPLLVNRTTGIEIALSPNSAKNWLRTLEPYFQARKELSYVSKKTENDIF